MDKCEGCPLDLGGKCHYWGYNPDDCAMTESDKELLTDFLAEITGDQVEKRLTPSDITALKSAIAGEGRLVVGEMGDCRTCEKLDYGCPYDVHTIYDHTKSKCPDWQDQGGE